MGKQYLNGVLYGTGEIIKFSPYIYSSEEREIGVWTDGKPIYQKTITGLSFNTVLDGWANSGASLSNVDRVVKCECGQNGSSMIEICFARVENSVLYIWTTNRVTYEFNIINILYTKSTDTPGSGTWTPGGEIAQHYSTTEQVVGTWIDGSTLYEKSYIITDPLSLASNTWTDTEFSDTGIDIITSCIAGYSTGGTVFNFMSASKRNSKITLFHPRSSQIVIEWFTIQYTKNTNTAQNA